MDRFLNTMKAGALGLGALTLSGCVSLGGGAEPPASLLTLSSTAVAPAGSSASTGITETDGAIAVLTPETPAKLNVLRVPVTVSATEIAYLQEAVWVEKPARLFRRLLGETLRARGSTLILDSDDTPKLAGQTLRGTLFDLGYDAASSSVVVRFDAIRTSAAGVVETRRFEASESGVLAEAAFVGPALNRTANKVAGEVAEWMARAPAAPAEPIAPSAPPIMDEASSEAAPAG
ncbi:ABC-type transport auxiliary lipoprotein family protein [uncultured Erythrobacter sp.]|uniref:ABC-type transport auxiliary lipoprotein family protein n=1 Tax=uncultured Erythrobacter sp. TaxID=263913 RepID=UPI002623EBBB|nr:ABC-type transport auxiliary lipoprotein family protein [uncultured Erythrobacter sp.]